MQAKMTPRRSHWSLTPPGGMLAMLKQRFEGDSCGTASTV